MSYLEKLLDGAGVAWVPLGEVTEIGTGSSNRQDENENGIYPFYVRSKNILKSDTFQFNETAIIIPGEGGIGDIFHYVQGKYALHQRAYRIRVTSKNLDTKFLYHFMCSDFKQYILMKSVGTTSISIRKPMLESFSIPIPCPENPQKSLAIQAEIVRILDAFTALTTELATELSARKKQYNHYRDRLLTFEEGEVEWKALGEVTKTITTGKLNANAMVENGQYPFFTCDANPYRIDTYAFDVEAIIVSGNGSQVGHINYYFGKFNAYQRTYVITNCIPQIAMRYLLSYLRMYLRSYVIQHSKKGSVPYITMPMLQNFKIPIPSPAKQSRIVAILDTFDTLTNSLQEGLPREIALRQGQYEYYRDLLLNFPRPQEKKNA
jgi:type I restriction enzyme S subunit